jgi:hypothetical protein
LQKYVRILAQERVFFMNKDDEKLEKFERLAQKRVSEVMNRLRLIGNLSDKRNYSFTSEHIREMFDAIESELRIAKSRFKSDVAEAQNEFVFKKRKSSK